MHDFACIRGATAARMIPLSSVSQAALDLARADPRRDVPCVLLMLHMPSGQSWGGKLTFAEADRMAKRLTELVARPACASGGQQTESPPQAPSTIDQPAIRPDTKLGVRIRRLRISRALSQRALGTLAGCTYATISAAERGKYVPSERMVRRIAAALGDCEADLVNLAQRERLPRRRVAPPPKASRRETA